MERSLDADLVASIRARLADDWRLTGEGDWQRTPKARRRKSETASPVGMLLGAVLERQVFDKAPLDPVKPVVPIEEKAVAKVEASLGFRLPAELRQLYLEIGDGNFGPFFGIRRLSNWAKDYLKLRSDLLAERGHPWPEALLPLVYLNGKRVCLDRESGAVVLWARPPKRCSAKKWQASFVAQSPSLAAWLARWVDTPTWCEGGPEGGWAPPEAEIERRAALERDKERKQAAVEERARHIEFRAHPPLADALLDRVVERAADPDRRTYTASAMARSEPVDLDALARRVETDPLVDDALKRQLGGMAKRVGLMSQVLGLAGLRVADAGPGFVMGFGSPGGRIGRPADAAAFARTEQALGFALPQPLRQLFELADGGFGPGDDGLWPLAKVLRTYQRYTATPQGPNDEPWPARLLPIAEADPAVFCFDLSTGAVVRHDVQDMDHLGRGQWERSFTRVAQSLADWLETWLSSSTFDEDSARALSAAHAAAAAARPSPVTGFPMQLDDPSQQAETEIVFLSHSPALRADFGLPQAGWEDEVRRRHGLL